MTKNEYNGWTNYETWAVNLWMDNEQRSHEYWRELASDALKGASPTEVLTADQAAAYRLAEQLKQEHEDALPELTGFAADLLNAAMWQVNWDEIAKNLIDAAKEEMAHA